MDRKLATIMVGDYVGSTSAMERNEESALSQVLSGLDLVTRCVSKHHGRVFNTAGDALLAEFESPVNGLKAAIEARSELATAPGLTPQSMRFGLHLADVVRVGEDLRGDGVNIAARLQQLAEPGEIDVSEALFDHVRRVSPCAFEDRGEHRLKGLDEAMRIMRVGASSDRHVFQLAPTVEAPKSAIKPNSIAVLPFLTRTGADEDQEFLAEGLTEELIHDLSLIRSLFVSSRTASVALQTDDPKLIGDTLGVRYVLAGKVRKMGSRVSLSVTLTRTSDGGLVWSDRIQRPFDEVIDAMEEIVARVAATVSGRIDHEAISAVRMKRPENMTAYEYYLRGLEQHRMGTVADSFYREAREWFRKSQEADPNFARPIAMDVCSWSGMADFDLASAEEKLNRAMQLDSSDPELHRILGTLQIKLNNDYDASRRHHERAMQLAPNDAYILGRCAAFYTFDGQPERALELLEHAATLDPFLPVWIVEEQVAALYALGRFTESNEEARSLNFQTRRSRLYRAASRVARGDIERAREIVAEALADDPTLSLEYVKSQELLRDTEKLNALFNNLRKAGLPDHPIASANS
ncbi:MAG: adenylate/guanylate cyclase domain-containing protein [Tateyamaria sp.]|uniref:adenylate/guanylate cyclase domain-containing protein n=2 Tax=Alphaproteobacteria TaxID=28211 RepID=UPI00329ED120